MHSTPNDVRHGDGRARGDGRSKFWAVMVVGALIAFLPIACGVTVYAWWVSYQQGYLDHPRTAIATLLAIDRRTATPYATQGKTPTFTTTLWNTPTFTPTLRNTPARPTRTVVVLSPLAQMPGTTPGSLEQRDRVSEPSPGYTQVATSTLIVVPAGIPTAQAITSTTEAVVTGTHRITQVSTATSGARAGATARLEPVPTTGTTPIPSEGTEPAPQPQGQIVFPVFDEHRNTWDLYSVRLDGGPHSLFHEKASQPAFSRDGSRLAFRRLDTSFLGLASFDLATGAVSQLTKYTEDAWPAWSYDVDAMLLFSSQRQSDRRWRLYGLMADSLIEWELSVGNKPVYGNYPAWLPGNQMLYSGCVSGNCGLIVADGDGSNPRSLTRNPEDQWGDPSPDGRWVAYVTDRTGSWDLYVVDAAGRESTPLLRSNAMEGSPEWSPDSRYVGFVSDRDGTTAVWAIAFDPIVQSGQGSPVKLFDLPATPAGGWPWLEGRIAWGP